MDKFEGDQSLLDVYDLYRKDIRQSYREGKSFCFAGGHGKGKMQDLETELPTPNGFIKLKDLKRGDSLFDENGKLCKVTKLHPIDYSPESYRITFDDGSVINACIDHLWVTHTSDDRRYGKEPTVKSTREILNTLTVGDGHKIANHSIPCCKPIEYNEVKLLLDPYTLGCWLGDGSSIKESADNEIKRAEFNVVKLSQASKSSKYRIGNVIPYGKFGRIGELTLKLKTLGVLNNKHIPESYLYSSYEQRLSLLQGLMDTDGYRYNTGRVEFCSVIPELAQSTHELALGLGIKSSINRNESYLNGKRCRDRYRVTFTTDIEVFKVTRKLKNIRHEKEQKTRTTHRFIKSIDPIDPVPMRCITVDSSSHLYLVTRSCIATHNTMSAACIMKRVVESGKYNALYVNLTDIVNLMASSSADDKEEKSPARKCLLMIDFLVIDEFDSRFMGSSDNAIDLFGRMLEPILRSRIQNNLPVILCTNNTNPDELFNNALKQSFKSLMRKIKLIPVLGVDHR